MVGYGKLRRWIGTDVDIVDFFLSSRRLLVAVRQLGGCARWRYRWDIRPTVRRLKGSLSLGAVQPFGAVPVPGFDRAERRRIGAEPTKFAHTDPLMASDRECR